MLCMFYLDPGLQSSGSVIVGQQKHPEARKSQCPYSATTGPHTTSPMKQGTWPKGEARAMPRGRMAPEPGGDGRALDLSVGLQQSQELVQMQPPGPALWDHSMTKCSACSVRPYHGRFEHRGCGGSQSPPSAVTKAGQHQREAPSPLDSASSIRDFPLLYPSLEPHHSLPMLVPGIYPRPPGLPFSGLASSCPREDLSGLSATPTSVQAGVGSSGMGHRAPHMSKNPLSLRPPTPAPSWHLWPPTRHTHSISEVLMLF